MSKTSDIKDRLLALSGFLRARHAATLLGCSPRTVVRNKYDGIDYGSVWYVRWTAVLQALGPDAIEALNLPSTAFVALDVARGFKQPTETCKEVGEYLEAKIPNFAEKANAAVEKAKLAIAKASAANSSLSVPAAVTEQLIVEEPPMLAMPVKQAEVLTVDGTLLVEDVDQEETVAKVLVCAFCGHAPGYHKTLFGYCKFAKGTIAACPCTGLV